MTYMYIVSSGALNSTHSLTVRSWLHGTQAALAGGGKPSWTIPGQLPMLSLWLRGDGWYAWLRGRCSSCRRALHSTVISDADQRRRRKTPLARCVYCITRRTHDARHSLRHLPTRSPTDWPTDGRQPLWDAALLSVTRHHTHAAPNSLCICLSRTHH